VFDPRPATHRVMLCTCCSRKQEANEDLGTKNAERDLLRLATRAHCRCFASGETSARLAQRLSVVVWYMRSRIVEAVEVVEARVGLCGLFGCGEDVRG